MSTDSSEIRGADQLLSALHEALAAANSDFCDAFITVRKGEYIRFAGGRVHQPQAIEECQLMVRAVAGSGAARVGTTQVESGGWAGKEAGRRARLISQLGSSPHPIAPVGNVGPRPYLWHEDAVAWGAAEKRELATSAIRAAEDAGATTNGMLSTVLVEMAAANSAGVNLYTDGTEASCSVLMRHGHGSGYRSDLARSAIPLRPSELIDGALGDAERSREPHELAPGSYDVILGPLAVGDILTFFGALGFTGDDVAAERGPVVRRPGEAVAAPAITVSDDALRPVGLPIPFDMEGVAKKGIPLIERGHVGEAVFDLASAAAVGRDSTGHAHIAREHAPQPTPANLIMEPGGLTQEELVAGVEHGVFISRFHYTRLVDPETTSFTGVTRDAAFLIQSGRLGPAVTQSRFTEEIFALLSRVDGVGNQLISQPIMNVWNGCSSAPALRVRGFRLGFH
ncbi:MAG: TldD/PmbA family protein [Candidatus Dormiibacterota bacterium]